jgi:VWFA-related protein
LCTLLALPIFGRPAPTFKSGATVVEVTTVVRDAQGKAVAGLTKDDFHLFDAGKQQPISSFEVEKLQDHGLAGEPPASLHHLRNRRSESGPRADATGASPGDRAAVIVQDIAGQAMGTKNTSVEIRP